MADSTTNRGIIIAAVITGLCSVVGVIVTDFFNKKIEKDYTPKQEVAKEFTPNEDVNALKEEIKQLQVEIRSLKKQGVPERNAAAERTLPPNATPAADTPAAGNDAPSKAPPGKYSATVAKVEITLNRCEKSGNTITCYLTYLNKDVDDEAKRISLYAPRVMMYDQDGNTYKAEKHAIGNTESYKKQGYTETEVIYDNPSKSTVTFDVGSNEVSKIAHLKIYTGLPGGDAELYNIAFNN